jgi:hypothetical protein
VSRRPDHEQRPHHSPGVAIPTRQSIGDRVQPAGAVFNPKIKTKQFANPLILWDHGEALVQHEFERIMVCAHDKGASPQVRPPMAHGLDQADEFVLISSNVHVLRREGLAEEHQQPVALV